MAYSDKAIELRRCLEPDCNNWALWSAPDQRCRWHSTWAYADGKHPAPTCTCAAYAWPHRPGGGLCQWPEEAAECCKTPPSTHKPGKRRSKWRVIYEFEYVAGRDPIEKLQRFFEEQRKDKR